MVSNLEVLRLRAPVGYYLEIFVRDKLAFRWRDLPLRRLFLGNGEEEPRRRHRKAGRLLHSGEVVRTPELEGHGGPSLGVPARNE